MAAYMIVDIEVIDPEAFKEYQQRVTATFARFGGRFVVRGGAITVLEGDWRPRRLVVVEFPSLEQANSWYTSREYREILPIRERCARSNVVLVEGV